MLLNNGLWSPLNYCHYGFHDFTIKDNEIFLRTGFFPHFSKFKGTYSINHNSITFIYTEGGDFEFNNIDPIKIETSFIIDEYQLNGNSYKKITFGLDPLNINGHFNCNQLTYYYKIDNEHNHKNSILFDKLTS